MHLRQPRLRELSQPGRSWRPVTVVGSRTCYVWRRKTAERNRFLQNITTPDRNATVNGGRFHKENPFHRFWTISPSTFEREILGRHVAKPPRRSFTAHLNFLSRRAIFAPPPTLQRWPLVHFPVCERYCIGTDLRRTGNRLQSRIKMI